MRCYFFSLGHINGFVDLTAQSDRDAIAEAQAAFTQWRKHLDGFEVWDRARMVFQFRVAARAG